MTEQPTLKNVGEGWEIPSFEEALFGEKRHHYALVIPVLNEGKRIRNQLERIRDAELSVDVILADGGSTDGSVDSGFVETANIRALLTKTGPGKLSAQLRMAYAWCIRQGYRGIVTVDGNGKDGVEAVASMVAMLEEGYDYVQGSRYLPGGQSENTPLERAVANRLFHAPLLSLAGRRWFTDTTNGFRAYSTRYLSDDRVQPFRDVFSRYELLFYLTVRAGQLGFRVGSAPVRRTYPKDGEVPTKIDNFGEKCDVLKQTLQAATGRFKPRCAASSAESVGQTAIRMPALTALFFTGLLWIVDGYAFGSGNQGAEVPPILSMIDNDQYLADFAIQDFLNPGPRYFFYTLVAAIASLTGQGVDVIYLILKLATHVSFFLALVLIARSLFWSLRENNMLPRYTAGGLAAFFMFFSSVGIFSWGSTIFDSQMVPATLAMAIAIWSLYFALNSRWFGAFLCSGVATFFQFLVGLYAGLTLLPALLLFVFRRRAFGTLTVSVAVWIIPALFVFGLTVRSSAPVPAGDFDFFEVFGRFRVPHHWIPSTGSTLQWISDAALAGAAALSLFVIHRRGDRALLNTFEIALGMLVMAAAGVLLNWLFVEVVQVEFIGKLQFQRVMPFGHLAAALAVVVGVCLQLREASPRGTIPLLVLIVILALPSLTGAIAMSLREGDELKVVLTVGLMLGTVLFFGSGPIIRGGMLAGTALLIVILNSPMASSLPRAQDIEKGYSALYSPNWDGERVSTWLRENSREDTLILIPPDWSPMSDRLALQARRAIYFSFKNVPYSDSGVYEWSRRAERLIGKPLTEEVRIASLRGLWQDRSGAEVIAIMEEVGACYLVDRLSDRSEIALKELARSEPDRDREVWAVWRRGDCPEGS